jgi:Tfp pilus assembly protein PilX
MGLVGMFFSMVAIAAGAVMYWAVTTTQDHGFRLATVGVILMIIGAVGLVASAVVFATSRRSASSRHHTYDRGATDSLGRSTEVHEEVH